MKIMVKDRSGNSIEKEISPIEAIRFKWTATFYSDDGEPYTGIVNGDIATLLEEIERLTKENQQLRSEICWLRTPEKSVGRISTERNQA